MQNNKGKDVLLTIVAALAATVVYHLAGKAISDVIADEFLSTFLSELLFAGLALGTAVALKQTSIFSCDWKHLKSGWTASLPLVALMLMFTPGAIFNALDSKETVVHWLLFICQMLLVGFAEEVLFRGLIQRSFHRFFGEDSYLHVVLAVFSTGAVFGLAHLINMDRGNPLLAALMQGLINIPLGALYCAIYYRTGKNIWYMIAIHALYDLNGMLSSGRMNGATVDTVLNVGDGTLTLRSVLVGFLVYSAVFAPIVLFILRPKKIEPLLSNEQE